MKTTIQESKNQILFIAPLFRFLVELTTWGWLLILGLRTFDINWLVDDLSIELNIAPWIFFIFLLLSLLMLSIFNFPGDKGLESPGYMVPGWLRIFIEIFSTSLGIFAAWVLFGAFGILFQLLITLIAFLFDRERWMWLLGYQVNPPDHVLAIQKRKK